MRLIDADALMADIKRQCAEIKRIGSKAEASIAVIVEKALKEEIDNTPTVEQPAIIRCQECIWWKNADCQNPWGLFMPNEDSFCSGGARKEVGE